MREIAPLWRPGPSAKQSWCERAQLFLQDIQADFDEAVAEGERFSRESWDTWTTQALQGSARLMHGVTRAQKVWAPTVVQSSPGIFTPGPNSLLMDETVKLGEHWNASLSPPTAWVPD
eukprot:2922408-Pyramimonas_sp.AAC.1